MIHVNAYPRETLQEARSTAHRGDRCQKERQTGCAARGASGE